MFACYCGLCASWIFNRQGAKGFRRRAALIFARHSGVNTRPFNDLPILSLCSCVNVFPALAARILARAAGLCFFPRSALLIRSLTSCGHLRPLFARRSAALCSGVRRNDNLEAIQAIMCFLKTGCAAASILWAKAWSPMCNVIRFSAHPENSGNCFRGQMWCS